MIFLTNKTNNLKNLMKKNINLSVALAAILFVTFASAEITFQDTFNYVTTVGDINTEYDAAGRQTGPLAPLDYSIGALPQSVCEVGIAALNPNKLTLTNLVSVCPNYNFTDSDDFTIEFDLFGLSSGWLGLMFGASSPGQFPTTSDGMSILLQQSGAYQIWNGSTGYGHTSNALPPFPYHITASVSSEDGATEVAIFANGVPLQMGAAVAVGTGNPFIFRDASLNGNYITLYSYGDDATIVDNLTVRSTVSKFFEFNWTDDADSRISTNKTYTHTVNLGADSDIDINGVTFIGSGSSYSGVDWEMINGYGDNNFVRLSTNATTVTGSCAGLLSDSIDDFYNQSTAIILSNLTPGQSYALTLYNYGLGAGARDSFLAASDSESSIVELNQNSSGLSGNLVKYFYTAPSNGIFSMTIASKDATVSWNYYAFSNEESAGPPVANVSASQGTYSNKIVVSWDKVSGVDKYQVYRNTFNDSSSAAALSTEITETVFTDTTATVNLDYYYWVKAKNTNGWSEFGNSVLGFCTDSVGPDQPLNILPIDGAEIYDFPVTLEGSQYSDAAWSMKSVQWRIFDNTNYSSIIWDSGEILTNSTNIIAPSGQLAPTNYWRVRYKNNRNKWSDWSDYTSFIVERDYDSPFYFYETFNNVDGSGDVNKDYFITGRQLGRVAPVDYISQGTSEIGDSATNPDKLTLSGKDSSCSPNQSFTKYDNFKIDIDMEPSVDGGAICFGKIAKNAKPESSGGMGFVFYGDGSGKYEVYDSEILVGIFTNDAVKSSEFHLMISTAGDYDSGLSLISAFVDGEPLILNTKFFAQAFHSNHYNYVYEKSGNFYGNYITLYNINGLSKFDNLQIKETTTNLNVYTWTNDADSRIGDGASVSNYTHAINLNTVGNIDINGVTFIGSGTSAVYGFEQVGAVHRRFVQNGTAGLVGSNWVVSTADGLFQTDSDWSAPANNLPAEGNKLLDHFLFSSWDGVQIKLNNLTPGSSNVFAMHFFQWWDDLDFAYLISGSDGSAPMFAQIATPGHQGDGVVFEYKYKASDEGKFTFILSNVNHPFFSFSNYKTATPEPDLFTIDSLDFGDVAVGDAVTFQLPVFNLGAGIVSGIVTGADAQFELLSGSNYSAQSESPDFLNISFTPVAEEDYSNVVFLAGSGGSAEVELKGIGVPEPISVIGNLLSVIGIFIFARRK